MSKDRRKRLLLHALRDQGIRDERVLAAIADIPREAFVEQPFADQAYRLRPDHQPAVRGGCDDPGA